VIIVGERVNATRASIAQAVKERDEELIRREIQAQDRAGAHFIDLNAGTGSGDRDEETDNLKWLADIALDATEKKLSLDASDPAVLRRTAEYVGKRRPLLLNSVNGKDESLDALLPFAARNGCPVIALAMDSSGIPDDVQQRLDICESILATATGAGVAEEDLFFDPLALPLSADVRQGRVTLETLRRIKADHPAVKTILGVTNVSHGLPRRKLVNQAFLIAATAGGLDAAICDPTQKEIRSAITLGELVAGRDRLCRRFARQVRKGELP
jgi:5-methyltetrahydrofolate--homocysteine methyltransferase